MDSRRWWRIAVGAVVALTLMGCIGPCAGVVDESFEFTPVDLNTCCLGADRDRFAEFAGIPVVPVNPPAGRLMGESHVIQVDSVATVGEYAKDRADDIGWEADSDGVWPPDADHEWVMALVTLAPGQHGVGRGPVHVVRDFTVVIPGRPRLTHSVNALVDPSDGEGVDSMIVVVRVRRGQPVLLTPDWTLDDEIQGWDGERRALDLRTGQVAKVPLRPPPITPR